MKIVLSEPWIQIAAIMAAPVYFLLLLSKTRLKTCLQEIRNRKAASLLFCLAHLRWYFLCGLLVFAVSIALTTGLHKLFVGVELESTQLVLDYSWPRSNVRLVWKDITTVEVKHKRSGAYGNTRFRLEITTGDSVYFSPWAATDKEIMQAREAIQTHLNKSQYK